MLSSYVKVFVVVFTVALNPTLGNELLHTLDGIEFPTDVNSVEYNPKIVHENVPESSVELPLGAIGDSAVSGDEEDGGQVPQSRRKRFWSSSQSSEEDQQADGSGYAAALDALLAYHEQVQRQGRRVVDIPDMHKETSDKLLFFTVTTRMSVTGVRLRVPASLWRVSRVTAEALPDGDVDMSCNVRLGDFETWGHYNVKVNGVGPSGEFETTIRNRVVHATVRFRELPAPAAASSKSAAAGDATTSAPPPRCSLEATELTLVEKGSNDVPAVLSSWASQVEDVPTTLRVMKQLLNERLSQFPCGDAFVALVRRGYGAAS